MIGLWTVEEVRAAERALMRVVPEGALMQRAAAGLARRCAHLLDASGRVYGARVVLLVGAGNNGGDALYAGARLARRGAGVEAVLLSPDEAHAGGLTALRAAGGRPIHAERLDPRALGRPDLVVDGIVGIGGRGALRPAAAALAAALADALTVAVDVPSGVDADTGQVAGAAIRADVTVTFGCRKPGLVLMPGLTRAGQLEVVDIGLAPYLPEPAARMLTADDVADLVPAPDDRSNKYSRGVLGVVAGSTAYTGAAVLTTGGALRGPVGMVRYAGTAADGVRARWPEVVVSAGRPAQAGRVQAWAVGPGIGTDPAAVSVVREVLAAEVPVLLDADAVTIVAGEPGLLAGRRAPTVLTPHDGEFARLGYEVGADRLAATRRAAADLGATVLLKGRSTVVAAPDGSAYVNPTGTPWLAAAGSGDVLTGLTGSLLASGLDPTLAAACGAWLHGLAGRLAAERGPITSYDVVEALPAAVQAVRRSADRQTGPGMARRPAG